MRRVLIYIIPITILIMALVAITLRLSRFDATILPANVGEEELGAMPHVSAGDALYYGKFTAITGTCSVGYKLFIRGVDAATLHWYVDTYRSQMLTHTNEGTFRLEIGSWGETIPFKIVVTPTGLMFATNQFKSAVASQEVTAPMFEHSMTRIVPVSKLLHLEEDCSYDIATGETQVPDVVYIFRVSISEAKP